MNTYVILLRGINVGGKNKVSMTALKECLEKSGFTNISTYINSGNVLLDSDKSAEVVQTEIENVLPQNFNLDSELIKILALSFKQLQAVITNKPKGFGEQPQKYHSDVIFLMGVDPAEAIQVFSPLEGVDRIWPGDGVIYSQRLSAQRTKSRLNKIMSSPLYESMTIRTWNTATKLLEMLNSKDSVN